MLHYWTKIINDEGKIVNSTTIETKKFVVGELHGLLSQACDQLDVPTPIILSKHINNLQNYNSATFLPADFIEKINFNKMVLELY